MKMNSLLLQIVFIFSLLLVLMQVQETESIHNPPFSRALKTLQNNIGYNFKSVDLLRRAMTHSSYSGENNKALSILGLSVIETSVSLYWVERDVEISSKDLSRMIKESSEVDSCDADGVKLDLEKIVRVSPKTNSSTPAIVCGAFRAIFGAIAVDASKADDAGNVYRNVTHLHSVGRGGKAFAQ